VPDAKAQLLPSVGANHAVSIELLMMNNVGETAEFKDAHLAAC
jgi:hypothetical protein